MSDLSITDEEKLRLAGAQQQFRYNRYRARKSKIILILIVSSIILESSSADTVGAQIYYIGFQNYCSNSS